MIPMLALLDGEDPARDAVLKFLGSYGGLAIGVAVLISGLKSLWPDWVKGKEPKLGVLLTILLGVAAKIVVPAVYGPHTIQSWTLHAVVLVFVAIGAGAFHDYVINAVVKKIAGPGAQPTGAPADPPKDPKEGGGA